MEPAPMPHTVKNAARLLYATVVIFFICLYFLGSAAHMPGLDIFLLMVIPMASVVYFIWLLTKGVFWVRSIFLAITIVNVINLITGKFFVFTGPYIAAALVIWLMQCIALWLLYNKESNGWYAAKLVEDNLKRLKRRGNLFGDKEEV